MLIVIASTLGRFYETIFSPIYLIYSYSKLKISLLAAALCNQLFNRLFSRLLLLLPRFPFNPLANLLSYRLINHLVNHHVNHHDNHHVNHIVNLLLNQLSSQQFFLLTNLRLSQQHNLIVYQPWSPQRFHPFNRPTDQVFSLVFYRPINRVFSPVSNPVSNPIPILYVPTIRLFRSSTLTIHRMHMSARSVRLERHLHLIPAQMDGGPPSCM